MSQIIVLYSSATTANRLKNALSREGVSASVMQTPKGLSKGGCSYCLRIGQSALPRLRELTHKMDVKIKAVYMETRSSTSCSYQPY